MPTLEECCLILFFAVSYFLAAKMLFGNTSNCYIINLFGRFTSGFSANIFCKAVIENASSQNLNFDFFLLLTFASEFFTLYWTFLLKDDLFSERELCIYLHKAFSAKSRELTMALAYVVAVMILSP